MPIAKGLFTRFMSPGGGRGSNSVLDYGLIDSDNVRNVSSFAIDANVRYRCGSDHALLQCEMAFSGRPSVKWNYSDVIKYNIHEKTNFTEFKTGLDEQVKTMSLTKFSTLSPSAMLPHLVECINTTARISIGNDIEIQHQSSPFLSTKQLSRSLRYSKRTPKVRD